MAGYHSNQNYSGSNPNLSKEEKICCSVDKKWERMDQFSNNELKKYADAKRMNKPYSVRCRKHTQACSLELTCSHCDERKPSRDFSNAQRKEVADRRRCRICVNYTETFDLFQNLPVLGDNVAPGNYKFESNSPNQGVGRLATENAASITAWGRGRNVGLTSDILNRYNECNPCLSRDGGFNSSSAPTDTAIVNSDESRGPRRQPQKYIAYGPNGQKQQRAQSVVTASEASSVDSGATGALAIATNRSGWAKIKGRKMTIQAPDLLTGGRADETFAPKRYDYSDSGSEDEC